MSDIRQQVNAALKAQEREYSLLKSTIGLWDLSDSPRSNARTPEAQLRKLGAFTGSDITRAGAIVGLNQTTLQAILGDGVTPVVEGQAFDGVDSRYNFGPDSFVLRLYSPKGLDGQGAWEVRLSLDEVTQDLVRDHKSTMIVSQGPVQGHSWLDESLKQVDLKLPIRDRELYFNAAGMLEMLFQADPGTVVKTRLATSLNVCLNNGLVTDTQGYAPLSHILTFIAPPPKSHATGSGKGASHVQKGGGGVAGAVELGLLASTGFKYKDKRVITMPLLSKAPGAFATDGDEYREVFCYPGIPSEEEPDMLFNNLSSMPEFKRAQHPRMAWFVKTKKSGGYDPSPSPNSSSDEHHHDYSYHGTTSDGGGNSGGGSTTPSEGGVDGSKGSGSEVPDSSKSGADPAGNKDTRARPKLDFDGSVVRDADGSPVLEYYNSDTKFWQDTRP